MEQPPAGHFFEEKGFPPYSFSFFFRPVLFFFLFQKGRKKYGPTRRAPRTLAPKEIGLGKTALKMAASFPTRKCGRV
jgi:hypothetical protein